MRSLLLLIRSLYITTRTSYFGTCSFPIPSYILTTVQKVYFKASEPMVIPKEIE